MKYPVFYSFTLITGIFAAAVFCTGCHLAGNSQPNNPFAAIQMAAPPATFSAQGAYLGQTPSASYTPQAPASTYVPSSVPSSGTNEQFSPVVPNNSPQPYSVPSSAGYGSLNPNQETLLFQNNSINSGQSVNQNLPASTYNINSNTAAQTTGWTAVPSAPEPAVSAAQSFPITAGYANQTASQGMENIAGQIIQQADNNGIVSSYAAPNTIVANSSQITTDIIDDTKKTPPVPAAAEPKTVYANQY